MNRFLDSLATLACWLAGIFTILVFSFFLGYVLWKGLPVLQLDFILGEPREITAGGGVGTHLFNTLYIVMMSMFFSMPIGLGAGIYLSEYSRSNIYSNFIRLSVESLATAPTIVLGLFGFIIFVNIMGLGFSLIGGSLALALLNMPMLV
ncbi:MAG TPA: phosphate ABC transporter, permease protein PstA, partial [Clostridia bacterium]|nr:phosphate ABC transporter, permease protein PstA [Clostridia bacterium]